jgi:CheY-like chemotaxis protein
MNTTKKICIIDDADIDILIAKKHLEVSGFDTIWVYKDGLDAFEGLKKRLENNEEMPDVILLDINMPKWNGWTFLEEFSRIYTENRIKIFMVSSSGNLEDIETSKKYSLVKDFIKKPLTSQSIAQHLLHQ